MNRNLAALSVAVLVLVLVLVVGLYLGCVGLVKKRPVAKTDHPVTSEVVLW